MNEKKRSQAQAQQLEHVRKSHDLPPRSSSRRFLLIFFSSSSNRASSWRPTASTRDEISNSPDGRDSARKPATHSSARFRSHCCRERRGAYKNALSGLRRSRKPFLKRRSRVVMTVV